MPNIQLAKNLRYLRKKNGLSQREMEEVLNLSRQAYSNYERCERTPDLDTLVRLAQFYGVSIDDLVLKNMRTPAFSLSAIKESVTSYYTYAECKETGNSVYLTDSELRLISDYRSLPEESKQIITGFLKSQTPK